MNKERTSRQQRGSAFASRGLFAIAIGGSALAVGSVHSMTLCIVTIVLAAAVAFAWWDAEPTDVRPAATILVFAGISLTAYTALQCVPMPVGWLAILAPRNADVWSRALAPLNEAGPRWAPLTLDPSATKVEVLKGVAYLLAFVTAVRFARRRDGVAFLSATLIVTGIVLAAAALLHPAFGAHKLFAVYEPTEGIADRHLAPLMNPNNLAGYLNVALCLSLAAAVAPAPAVPRPVTAAIVLLLGATQLWVASRSGVVAMALGALTVLVIAGVARRNDRERAARTLSLVAGLAAAMGATLIVFSSSEEASGELLVSDTSKLTVLWHMMRMLSAFSLFGCGRGAFESAYASFRVESGYVTFAYPENVVAQWVLEWGVPVGIAGLAALVYSLRARALLARSTTAAGAWAALVTLAVQNLGDLGSEIPALALAGVACSAIVVGGLPGCPSRGRVGRWARMPRVVTIGALATSAIAISVVFNAMPGELHHDQRALYNAALEQHVSAEGMRDLVRAGMLRHPAEPYLPFIAALRASYVHDDNPLPWIGATLERASVYAPAHLVLARVVASRSRSQARFEYRRAMEQSGLLAGTVMAEAPRLVGSYTDAMELVPDGPIGAYVLDTLVSTLASRLPSTCVQLDEELRGRDAAKPEPATRAAQDAAEDLRSGAGAPWCDGAAHALCVRDALDKANRAELLAPTRCQPRVLHARARVASGDPAGGLRELEAAADATSERVTCLQELVGLAGEVGDDAVAEDALRKVANAGCAEDAQCVSALIWVAGKEESRGYLRKALGLYKRANDKEPDNDMILENVARLAAQAGLHFEAAETYEKLLRRHPGETRWTTALEAERDAIVKL